MKCVFHFWMARIQCFNSDILKLLTKKFMEKSTCSPIQTSTANIFGVICFISGFCASWCTPNVLHMCLCCCNLYSEHFFTWIYFWTSCVFYVCLTGLIYAIYSIPKYMNISGIRKNNCITDFKLKCDPFKMLL